jgi:hypothetical protein
MIPFTLSKDISFELPQDYGELTLKQFYELRKPDKDLLDLLSILSGLSRDIWEQAKDFNIDVKIAPYLVWMERMVDLKSFILEDHLKIGNKICKRPTDLRSQSFGQKIALEKHYYKVGNDLDCMPYALALYFQPIYFEGKYNSEQVDELLPLIMECKLGQAYPIASFFLNSYSQLLISKKTDWLMLLHRKKVEQGLIDLRNSKSSARYTPFQKALTKIMKKFC